KNAPTLSLSENISSMVNLPSGAISKASEQEKRIKAKPNEAIYLFIIFIIDFLLERCIKTKVYHFSYRITKGVVVLGIEVPHTKFIPGKQILPSDINPHCIEPNHA